MEPGRLRVRIGSPLHTPNDPFGTSCDSTKDRPLPKPRRRSAPPHPARARVRRVPAPMFARPARQRSPGGEAISGSALAHGRKKSREFPA